jgi:thiamine pyrophosphokinase
MREAVIIANGELSDHEAVCRAARQADLLIAADGGAQHCRALGVMPHIVVGDLDSMVPRLRAELEQAGTRFETYPARKDETDLELAIFTAIREGAQSAVVFGALGARWDQSLANLLLLAHPRFAPLRLRLVHGADTFWIAHEHTTVHGAAGDRLSLVPLAGDVEGVTLTGVEYPLTEGVLHFGYTTGISNALTAPEVLIRVRKGTLLIIHTQIIVRNLPPD